MKHLTCLSQWTRDEVESVFALSAELKATLAAGGRPPLLQGRVITQVFEKPSLRTRVSFEAAAAQLSGTSLFLTAQDAGLQGREATADVARVLSSYSDVIVMRTFSQTLIEEFAAHAQCPIINGLSDERHPCQALTDLFTIREVFGDLAGRTLVYVGDGNNVAASLAGLCAMLDVTLILSTPEGYSLDAAFVDDVRRRFPSARIVETADPRQAVREADVIYTDVWTSMGQEAEAEQRRKAFAPYQVNAALMKLAPPTARFMHCLPARRGNEVTADVLDGPQSVAFQQAENRMHIARGLLVWLLDAGQN